MRSPLEAAVVAAFPYLLVPLLVSPLLLLVATDSSRFVVSNTHLSAVVALALVLAMVLAPRVREDWFQERRWAPHLRRLAGGAALVVVVTGVVALVTLASSAALRLQPSLQFLQLLSALDIAWATAAVVIGGHLLWSRAAAAVGGLVVAVACVFSIWNYLRVVGFTDDGGWLLDGGELMKLVIPFDMAAAAAAITVLVLGSRRAA